jgi:hypothetical protein
MTKSMLELIVFGSIITFCLAIGTWNLHVDNQRMKHSLDYYDANYLRKQGGTTSWPGSKGGWVNYDLRSFDAGKHWYVVTNNGDGFVIVGEAEKIYPGLIDNLDAWDAIVNYAQSNGPISLNNSQQVQLMERAGFQIKSTPTVQLNVVNTNK